MTIHVKSVVHPSAAVTPADIKSILRPNTTIKPTLKCSAWT